MNGATWRILSRSYSNREGAEKMGTAAQKAIGGSLSNTAVLIGFGSLVSLCAFLGYVSCHLVYSDGYLQSLIKNDCYYVCALKKCSI